MKGQTVVVRKLITASREEVFDAWLDADGMREWMRPGPVTDCAVTLEPHVGGNFKIVMSSPEGETVSLGEILILERPSKLQFTWISSRWDYQETLLTVELRQAGTQCQLTLTHERFPVEHSSSQLVGGWNQILEKLGSLFDGSARRGRSSSRNATD